MSRRRFFDGAQHRFQAHDRRWRLLLEAPDPTDAQRRRALAWAAAYLRRERVVAVRSMIATALELMRPPYEPPKATAIGNIHDLLAQVCPPHDDA